MHTPKRIHITSSCGDLMIQNSHSAMEFETRYRDALSSNTLFSAQFAQHVLSNLLGSTLQIVGSSALEIGVLVAGVLFGVITAQVYIHHKSFPRESLWIKHGLVDFMWVIELGHTICVFHAIYFYTVTRFGDADALVVLPASIGAAVVLHGIVLLIVQGFFTYRIALFSGKPYIVPVLSGILIFCQMLAVYMLSAQLITVATKSLREFMDKWEWLMFTVLILRAIADVLISGSLVYHLVRCRHGTFKSTVAIVDKLILWSIETDAWLALLMFIPKVFSNAMLANMNSRVELQNMSRSVIDSTGVFTTGAFAAVPFGPQRNLLGIYYGAGCRS
ncbi:hypothetical protein F5890DRAFT_791123 [Lentinula detonsa]|uniref:DUF6534 domain-containing protein n=1 Tax=Lentinula detonsa TaxID=2804962 RepID=A0AA38PQZ3_9AGAR|nr:hypothetical protein F5890DRAFT_791123 [Lentinula detonsa]